jgi:hypothetical protein
MESQNRTIARKKAPVSQNQTYITNRTYVYSQMVKRKFRKRIHLTIQSKMRGPLFIGQKTGGRNTHMPRLPRTEQRDDQKLIFFAPDSKNFGPNISRQIFRAKYFAPNIIPNWTLSPHLTKFG